jgi:hypothetical protein
MADEHVEGGRPDGRSYWREADARRMIEAWQSSGLSLKEFSRQHGIQSRRLARWSHRLGLTASPERPQFHPVHLITAQPIAASGEDPSIEIILPHGQRVGVRRGFAAEDLRSVLEVLEARVRC